MRIKIAPWFTLFLSIIIVFSNLSLFFYFKNSTLENTELRLIKSADNVLVEIGKNPNLFLKDPKDYIFSTTKNEFTSSGILVQFMGKDGDLLARSPSLKHNSLPFFKNEDDVLKDVEFENNLKLKVYQREIIDAGNSLGYAIFGITTSPLYHNFDILLGILSILTFATIAALWLGINALISVDLVKKQQRFLSFASHELRTPLSVISGIAEVALRSPPFAR
ncbi:hypothetical protein HZC34_03710 [Candidatus Saganbacteria bacterium]|nr:hypothetical protein [Candidatus Saganbacteria bacterium]